ncbi:uncharacterized protein [Palaemon carinicauda]|uniref:uncharacterized protein isoform X2 n=1 Tax=Palaemon carinicauda TaxID=392227 RepID=UPI0035B6A4E4
MRRKGKLGRGKRRPVRGKKETRAVKRASIPIVVEEEELETVNEDSVEREGKLAVDLLNKKIQWRKLVDNMSLNSGEEYFNTDDEVAQTSATFKKTNRQSKPPVNNQRANSAKKSSVKARKDQETKKYNVDVIEDEEVLRIIGALEKEVDDDDVFSELTDVGEKKQSDVGRSDDIPKCNSDRDKETKKITIQMENGKEENSSTGKEIGGLTSHGPYSRILVIGDSRLQSLEECWPKYPFVKPQFFTKPHLKLEEVKDFILSQTELPHLENGTLLICSVGLYDIINLVDYDACVAVKNHKPMKVMTLTEKAAEDLIKIVLLRLNNTYKALEEILDSSSVVCFSAILPADPTLHFDLQARDHTPEGHANVSPLFRGNLNMLMSKILLICSRVNKQLEKLSPLPSVWNIMASYHIDRQIVGRALFDGINISSSACQLLAFRLNRFLQELFYGVEIKAKYVEYQKDQKVIVVGDCRMMELQKEWCGDKPEFYCEPNLGFYNFDKFMKENLVGLRNKIVIVCLGLNDLVQFIDHESCLGKDHEPCQVVSSVCERYSNAEEYFEKVLENFKSSFTLFCKTNPVFIYFATVYPIHLNHYIISQGKIHKDKTGHDIGQPERNSEIHVRLQELLINLNSFIRHICSEQGLPFWDMYHIVCRGHEASTLSPDVLVDGIYPSERTIEELIRSFFAFVNEKFMQELVEDKNAYKYPFRPLPRFREPPTSQTSAKYVKQSSEKKDKEVIKPSNWKAEPSEKREEMKPLPGKKVTSRFEEKETPNIEKSKGLKLESSTHTSRTSNERSKTLKEEKMGSTKQDRHSDRSKHGDHRRRSSESSHPEGRSQQPNVDTSADVRRRPSSPGHWRHSPKDDHPSVFYRIGDKRHGKHPRLEERRYPIPSPERSTRPGERRYPFPSPERHPRSEERRYPFPSPERHPRSEERRYPLPSPERHPRGGERRYPNPSPERMHRSRTSRSPEWSHRSRSPVHGKRRSPYNERSWSPMYNERSRSPHYNERPRYSRSPERYPKTQRTPERSHEYREPYDSGEQPRLRSSGALDAFTKSIRKIRKQCQKEKDSVIRDALLDLFSTHVHECDLYLAKPDAHPDYSKEYRLFLEKKRGFIVSLGGDPDSYDYIKDWEKFWPTRMFDLFKESWESKKKQCTSMISSRRKRSPSSSASSRSSRSSSSSRSSRSPSPDKKRKRSKNKVSRFEKISSNPHKKETGEGNSKWKPLGSFKDMDDNSFIQDVELPRNSDIMKKLPKTSLDKATFPREPEKLKGPNVPSQSLPYDEKVTSALNVTKEGVKVVEVLSILTYLKDKLGVLGLPVNILYDKAVKMEKKGLDPNTLLEDEETATLFCMLSDKLSSLVEEGDGSTIQKAIALEAHSLLLNLIDEIKGMKKKSDVKLQVNIAQIARLTMGKTISDTIITIKNFLVYEGYSDISKEDLEVIYMSVKDEQLKLTGSSTPSQISGSLSSQLRYEGPKQKSMVGGSTKSNHSFKNFMSPEDELTEEFFIGKRSFSDQDATGLLKPSMARASTSKFDSRAELDEEFFTGKKFLKPKDSHNREITKQTEQATYIPHKHVLPPPAPIISGMSSSQLFQNTSSNPPSAPVIPLGQLEAVNYDFLRQCLVSLQNMPK